jgi:hypothetical protein
MDGTSELDGLIDGARDGLIDDEGTNECLADGFMELEGVSE